MQKTDNSRIAVLTVTYNHEAYIGQCIESVLAQQCSLPVMHYVWDDCSTDGTREIIDGYSAKHPDNVIVFHQPDNVGAARNYWDGLEAILSDKRNQYIAYLDGDDYFCDNKCLEKKIQYFASHPSCGIVHSNYKLQGDDGHFKDIVRYSKDMPQGNILKIMVNYPQFAALTVVFRRSALENIPLGELRQLPLLTVDHLLEVWACSQSKAGFIEDITGVWRRHGNTISTPRSLQSTLKWIEHECAQGRWLNAHFEEVHFGPDEETAHRANEQFAAYARAGIYKEAHDILTKYPFVANEYPTIAKHVSRGALYFKTRFWLKKLYKAMSGERRA